jgi:hypothetical protein
MKFLITSLLVVLSYVGKAQTSDPASSDTSEVATIRIPNRTNSDTLLVHVVVGFAIDKKGNMTDVQVLENKCKRCSKTDKNLINAEVIRIVKQNPYQPWKDENGAIRPGRYKQPVQFIVTD